MPKRNLGSTLNAEPRKGHVNLRVVVTADAVALCVRFQFYRSLNIRIALVGLEVWTHGNMCEVSENPYSTLWSFLSWRRKLLTQKNHDNAQLITYVAFVHVCLLGAGCTARACSVGTLCRPPPPTRCSVWVVLAILPLWSKQSLFLRHGLCRQDTQENTKTLRVRTTPRSADDLGEKLRLTHILLTI